MPLVPDTSPSRRDLASSELRARQVGSLYSSLLLKEIPDPNPQEAIVSDEIEYEEINSEEVDRVVAAIEELMATTNSETIKAFLEECSTNVYYLVYDDEEGTDSMAA